jgi:POT family proton-dependent oligopeptide transporter
MSKRPYATAPRPSTRAPAGIPYIIGNEAAERFSYYGMRAVLVVFMTRYLMGQDGDLALMTDEQAKSWYHLFGTAVYATPLLGALLSDIWLGKYRTILGLSVVYCLGHLALALDDTRTGLALGLGLIALGSGGIKPCVSAHVGDQFGATNAHLLRPAFAWFYFAINFGASLSTLLTPILLDRYGPHAAFGLPGLLMGIATLVFWLGRHEFVHIPPGGREFTRQLLSREGLGAIARLSVIFVFIVMFWALFDQTGSAWIVQAREMDRVFLGIEWLPSQIQAVNPLMVLALIPFFNGIVYPFVSRFARPTPLRRIGAGFFLAVGAFLVNAQIEVWIAAGLRPNIAWQLLAYLILTSAEVLVSITALEFSYTQAPRALKSVVMALNLMSMSLGNLFTALVNILIQGEDGEVLLTGAGYYLFFAGAMAATAVLFVPVALAYRGRTYLQDEQDEHLASGPAPVPATGG